MRLGQCPAIKKVSPLHDRCAEVKFFYDLSGKAVFNAGKLYGKVICQYRNGKFQKFGCKFSESYVIMSAWIV